MEIGVSEFNAGHVAAAQSRWKERAPWTQKKRASELRWLLQQLAETGYPNLSKAVEMPKTPKPRSVTPTPGELASARSVPQLWLRWIVLCASEAGLRTTTAVRVKVGECQTGRIQTATKGGQRTDVPVSPRLAALLAILPPASPEARVVDVLAGEPVREDRRFKAWGKWKKKTGIRKELRLHDLRRGLARSMLESGSTLRQIQRLLSHKMLTSTMWYLDAGDEPLKEANVLRAIEAQEERP
jgi:integrase